MAQNLFEELQEKKKRLTLLVDKAVQYGWITTDRANEIIQKLNSDVLTIGVIGQMKCGKSTFLNAFVFEDDVLPAATTPMTAALSIITYGEEKKMVAEFYTSDEWEEQKMMASRPLEEVQGNALEESKVKAAKELVAKAVHLGDSLNSYLGKTQNDSFDNLIEYVGADGKYVSITKSVTIYYPKEYLKGVEIVDTPGFNDPIVSREERTKAFLKKADVVLMMLYAGRPFDATDREILFQNVRQCGVGKVIIGINKYDIPYENGETEEEIKEYVKREIRKASKESGDDTLTYILKDSEPIPLSAEMALLSELPMSKVSGNEAFLHAWKRACNNFEISSQSQMREKSHLEDLTSAIKQIVETEKGSILFAKPFNSLCAAGNIKKEKIDRAIRECDSLIVNLSIPDNDLEKKQKNLTKALRRLEKKIDILGDEIDCEFKNLIRKGTNDLEDSVDATCHEMVKIVGDWSRVKSVETLIPKLDKELQHLTTRTLKRSVIDLGKAIQSRVRVSIREFLLDAEDIFIRFVQDFDSRDFMKSMEKGIQIEIDKNVFMFDTSSDEEDFDWKDFFGNILFNFFNGYSFGALGLATNIFSHSENKRKLLEYINSISADFDPQPFLEDITLNKDVIIDNVRKKIIDETILPMKEQIEKILLNLGDKELQLKDAKNQLESLKLKQREIDQQIVGFNLYNS